MTMKRVLALVFLSVALSVAATLLATWVSAHHHAALEE
jgi:hypothetical protein